MAKQEKPVAIVKKTRIFDSNTTKGTLPVKVKTKTDKQS